MREILFRGKRIEEHPNKWAEGFYDFSPSGNHYITETIGGCAHVTKVYPETVGQYTGIKDKNGERIFEADKIAGLFHQGFQVIGTVGFADGAFGVRWMRGDAEMFTPFTSTCNVEWEVVEDG